MIDVAEMVGGPLSEAAQKRVSMVLFTWLVERVRKSNELGQDKLLEDMQKEIDDMAKSIQLGFSNGRVVVTVTGRGDSTLRCLRNGTSWFDPHPNVNEMIAAAALSS